MAAAKARRPTFTENFSGNLRSIEAFLGERSDSFERLLDRLLSDIVPTLVRFPRSGRLFLTHSGRSTKAVRLVKRLTRCLAEGEELREFIVDDYIVLYLLRAGQVVFLAIKHHRQMSFDLLRFWQEL